MCLDFIIWVAFNSWLTVRRQNVSIESCIVDPLKILSVVPFTYAIQRVGLVYIFKLKSVYTHNYLASWLFYSTEAYRHI